MRERFANETRLRERARAIARTRHVPNEISKISDNVYDDFFSSLSPSRMLGITELELFARETYAKFDDYVTEFHSFERSFDEFIKHVSNKNLKNESVNKLELLDINQIKEILTHYFNSEGDGINRDISGSDIKSADISHLSKLAMSFIEEKQLSARKSINDGIASIEEKQLLARKSINDRIKKIERNLMAISQTKFDLQTNIKDVIISSFRNVTDSKIEFKEDAESLMVDQRAINVLSGKGQRNFQMVSKSKLLNEQEAENDNFDHKGNSKIDEIEHAKSIAFEKEVNKRQILKAVRYAQEAKLKQIAAEAKLKDLTAEARALDAEQYRLDSLSGKISDINMSQVGKSPRKSKVPFFFLNKVARAAALQKPDESNEETNGILKGPSTADIDSKGLTSVNSSSNIMKKNYGSKTLFFAQKPAERMEIPSSKHLDKKIRQSADETKVVSSRNQSKTQAIETKGIISHPKMISKRAEQDVKMRNVTIAIDTFTTKKKPNEDSSNTSAIEFKASQSRNKLPFFAKMTKPEHPNG